MCNKLSQENLELFVIIEVFKPKQEIVIGLQSILFNTNNPFRLHTDALCVLK